jgi:hypothetical protein
MVLSTLRIPDEKDIFCQRICGEADFSTALRIAILLEKHAVAVFKTLPTKGMKGLKLKFYEALPKHFDRQTFLNVAEELGIREKNAEKYISLFKPDLLRKEGHMYFKK